MRMIERKKRRKKKIGGKRDDIEKDENRKCSFRPSVFPTFIARSFFFVIDEFEALDYASRHSKAEVEREVTI